MPHYYLGPLAWITGAGPPHWGLRPGVGPRLDFRPHEAQAAKGGTPIGYGFFELPQRLRDESGYDYLGDDLYASVSLGGRTSWQQRLGLSRVPEAHVLRELLWEIMTAHGDPSGTDRHAPVLPGRNGFISMPLVNLQQRMHVERPFWPAVQDRLRRDYRRLRERALEGKAPSDLHQKFLTGLLEKFGLKASDRGLFIPSDLPDELPRPRATTFTEDFNRADQSGWGPDLTWTEVVGQAQTTSNQGSCNTGGTLAMRAEHDVSSDDHYAELDVTVLNGAGDFGAPACRFASDAQTAYVCYLTPTNDGETQLWKVIEGSYTQIGSAAVAAISLPDTMRVQADGSAITALFNVTTNHMETDSSITGNTRGGADFAAGAADSVMVDDWEVSDLAAPPAGGSHLLMLMGVGG